jgi:selenide,water dikinase
MTYSGMVPGHVAGRYALVDCQIDIARVVQPLVQAAVALKLQFEWRRAALVALDANTRQLGLSDGSELRYDWLSLDVGGVADRDAMAGASEHALFVRPIEQFAALWPRLQALSEQQPLHVAVVGGGAGGVELAFALARRVWATDHLGAVTLVTGGSAQVDALLPGHANGVRRRVAALLKRRGVTVLQDRVTAVQAGSLHLASGAQLQCDAPVLATPVVGPAWLQGSGLALDDTGFVQTGPTLQSISHASVFAAGDVATRSDVQHPRSGVYALRAGPPLARNLAAVLQGQAPSPWVPQHAQLNLLDTADGGAVLSWGGLAAGSALTRPLWGAWKRRLDEGFVRSFQ